MLSECDARERIAARIALEFSDGDAVNLGIGIPTLITKYIPKDIRVIFQSENGVIGAGPPPAVPDYTTIDAGGRPMTLLPGGCYMASDMSFGVIRGGHLDMAVLGAFEVSARGDISNWVVPGRNLSGMGGAMDLVTGARRVFVAMTHTAANGRPKIVEKCSLPLTAVEAVDKIFTELAVFDVSDKKLTLREIAPETSLDELASLTGAKFEISPDLTEIKKLR